MLRSESQIRHDERERTIKEIIELYYKHKKGRVSLFNKWIIELKKLLEGKK